MPSVGFVASIALLLAIGALLVAAHASERAAFGTRDYAAFDRRAALSHRFAFSAVVLFPLYTLVASPGVGLVLSALLALWCLAWAPVSRRRMVVEASATFAAPPETVASVMFDITGQPRWIDGIVSNVVETPGLVRVGTVIKQTIRIRGHDLVARCVVTELVPYERLVYAVMIEGAPTDVFEVKPEGRGAIARYAGSSTISWIAAILGGWRRAALQRQFTANRAAHLERLRALVERPALA